MADAAPLQFDNEAELELLHRVANKDRAALEQLYLAYIPKLSGFLRNHLFEDRLIEEVYNDVMLVVWDKAAEFREASKVSTWIFAIAYRTCMAHARKELKHVRNTTDCEFDSLVEPVEDDSARSVRDALDALSPDHRTAVELAYFVGCSIDEIAYITDTPSNTVKTRLFHARLNLKKALEIEFELAQKDNVLT